MKINIQIPKIPHLACLGRRGSKASSPELMGEPGGKRKRGDEKEEEKAEKEEEGEGGEGAGNSELINFRAEPS